MHVTIGEVAIRFPLTLLALCAPVLLHAQRVDSLVTLTGRVIDGTDSGGIARAALTVVGSHVVAYTDGWGYYHLYHVPRGATGVDVRALGYVKLRQSVALSGSGTLHQDLVLTRLPHLIAEMVINGRAMRVPRGFEEIYRRGALGWGAFITREQIDSMDPVDLKTMLATIPGVFVNDRGVFFQRCHVGNPQLWIDGQRVTRFKKIMMADRNSMGVPPPDPYFLNEMLAGVKPNDVQAIEVYRSNSETPAEFLDGSGCGVVAVWTLRGP